MQHHWLWVMKMEVFDLMRALGFQPSLADFHPQKEGIVLGGKITVSGQNACIVCFHGASFRETEWAIFSVDLVNASFSTEATPGLEDTFESGDRKPSCRQVCSLSLGGGDVRSNNLGAIYRVSAGRTHIPPVTGTSLQDWLMFACITHHLRPEVFAAAASLSIAKLSKKLSVMSVLLVPAFDVRLQNDHHWPALSAPFWLSPHGAGASGEIPLVKCALTSSFSSSISVTTTVEHYIFLHDVIKGYVDTLTKSEGLATQPSELSV